MTPQSFSRASIELALERLQIDCRFGPKEAVARCVFHNDREGGKKNLYVNLVGKPGVYHCFVCDARGPFENLVLALTGWTMVKTVIFMRECVHATALTPYEPPQRAKTITETDEERLAPYMFRHSYLKSRGLLEDTLVRFQVGYDRKDNAIVFPWFDSAGRLVSIKRRNVIDKFYSAERDTDTTVTLFGLQHVKLHGHFWITEGEFDAMFLDQCFRLAHFSDHFALALGGTILHEKTIGALLKRQPDRVVLLLDNDDAGRAAQAVLRKQLIGRVPIAEPTYTAADPNDLTFEQSVQLVRSLQPMRKS